MILRALLIILFVLDFTHLAKSQSLEGDWVFHYVRDIGAQRQNLKQDSLWAMESSPATSDTLPDKEVLDEVIIRPEYSFIGAVVRFANDGTIQVFSPDIKKKKLRWKRKGNEIIVRKNWLLPKARGTLTDDSLILKFRKAWEEAYFYFYKLPSTTLPAKFPPQVLLSKIWRWNYNLYDSAGFHLYESFIRENYEDKYLLGSTITVDNHFQWGYAEGQQWPYYFDAKRFFIISNPSLFNPTLYYLYNADADTLKFLEFGLRNEKPFRSRATAIAVPDLNNQAQDSLANLLIGTWKVDSSAVDSLFKYQAPFTIVFRADKTFNLNTSCPEPKFLETEKYDLCEYSGTWIIDDHGEILLTDRTGKSLISFRTIAAYGSVLFIPYRVFNYDKFLNKDSYHLKKILRD